MGIQDQASFCWEDLGFSDEQVCSVDFVLCEEKSTYARNECNEVKLSLETSFHVRTGVDSSSFLRELMHLTFYR